MKITFFVPGDPKPGGSKRAFINPKTGKPIITDACKGSKPWRADVKHFAYQAYSGELLKGPLILTIVFYRIRPKFHFGTGRNAGILKASAPKYPEVQPDATKLVRSTEDALTKVLWHNDNQIVEQHAYKEYGKPGAQISVELKL